MNTINILLAKSALALGLALPIPGFAQASMDSNKMNQGMMAMPDASMTDGEVRKVDKEAGKLTIKHGAIKHMDMPGMTMVFTVRDKTALNTVKVGDKIFFKVMREDGKMIVTDIQAAR